MVLEGKLDAFKCGCDKHYKEKRGDVVFCFVKENGLKWGGGPQLCQGEQVGGGEVHKTHTGQHNLSGSPQV